MNTIFQPNAKKGRLIKMDLDRICLEPGLFLEIVPDKRGLSFLVHTKKEWKQLKKTKKQK